MIDHKLPGPNGYDITLRHNFTGQEKAVVIALHGMGSKKETEMNQKLAAAIAPYQAAVYAFDLPAHGESPADDRQFTIANCIKDLAAVEQYVKQETKGLPIYYFAFSFGGYILMYYLIHYAFSGQRAVMASAALTMPKSIRRQTSKEGWETICRDGYVFKDQWEAPMRVYRELYDDLAAHEMEALDAPKMPLRFVHGTADPLTTYDEAQWFCQKWGYELKPVEGAGHHFNHAGEMEQVMELAVEFLFAK